MDDDRIERCDVWELARSGGMREGRLPVAKALRLAAELADAQGALRYRFSGLTDERDRPAARLDIDGELRLRCDRCGEPVAVTIRERVQFYFVADEAELARLPIDDAPDEPLLGSRRFDLAGLIEDQAILALPLSPRHAGCAAPLHDETADGEAMPKPFAALADVKRRRS